MSITEDPDFLKTTYVTIDFETLTPTGRRPEAIEVALLAQRFEPTGWVETGRFTSLMCPPSDVPVTYFDTAQTGITAAMLAGKPRAETVLAAADRLLQKPPYVLVAHNAPYEAGLIFDHHTHCPRLAHLPLLDTVRLARIVYPELARHRLDDVVRHLQIPPPIDRHRALPDTEVTAAIFTRIVADGAANGLWSSLADLLAVAGIVPRAVTLEREAAKPQQGQLFD